MDGMAIRQERRNPKEKAKKTNPLPMNVQVIPKKEKPKPGDKEFKPSCILQSQYASGAAGNQHPGATTVLQRAYRTKT